MKKKSRRSKATSAENPDIDKKLDPLSSNSDKNGRSKVTKGSICDTLTNVNEYCTSGNNGWKNYYNTPFFTIPTWFNDIICILGSDFGILIFE